MKSTNIKKIEEFVDGSVIVQYTFHKQIDKSLMEKIGENGKITYFPYPEFLRPFFKIVTPEGFCVKGIIGDTKVEVVFPDTDGQEKKTDFETHLEAYLNE